MNRRPVLVAIVVAACLAVAIAAPAAGQSEPAVGFGDSQREVAQGDIATIDVQIQNTEASTLRIYSADQTYRATLRVRDGNGDGTVRVQFNTFRATSDTPESAFTTADAADEANLLTTSHSNSEGTLEPGRYNLILSASETSIASSLSLIEPDAPGGSNTDVVAPGTPLLTADTDDTDESSDTVADGDARADTDTVTAAAGDVFRTRFSVRGIGGIVEDDAPARNLVFPADSSPAARTTHAVSTSPDESISGRSITIDYGVDESVPPKNIHRISRSDIKTLGVDRTGDGYVDRSLRVAIQNIRTSTDGRLTITFDRPINLGSSDTFISSYAIQNPEITGSQDVTVRLTGDETTHHDHGQILYGPAGQGTLGNGIDLRVESTDRDRGPTVPLAALEAAYNSETGELITDADTEVLGLGEHTVTLSIGESAPEPLSRIDLTDRVVVVEPNAEFTDLSTDDSSQLAVRADTNLAPENTLTLRVQAEDPSGGISQVQNCVTTVEYNGSIACNFDLEGSATNFDIEVSIKRGDTVIAGPIKF